MPGSASASAVGLSFELYNLFVLLLTFVVLVWVSRVCKRAVAVLDLRRSVADNTLIRLDDLGRIPSEYELLTRSHFTQMMRSRRHLVNQPMETVSVPFSVRPESLRLRAAEGAPGELRLECMVDTAVQCRVNVLWGVSSAAIEQTVQQWEAKGQRGGSGGGGEAIHGMRVDSGSGGQSQAGHGSGGEPALALDRKSTSYEHGDDPAVVSGPGAKFVAATTVNAALLQRCLLRFAREAGVEVLPTLSEGRACAALVLRHATPIGSEPSTAEAVVVVLNLQVSLPPTELSCGALVDRQLALVGCDVLEMRAVYGGPDDAEESDGMEECVICLSDDKQVTLLPCRHMCVCLVCLRQIDKCPICRNPYRSYVVTEA